MSRSEPQQSSLLTGKSSDWGIQPRHQEWIEDFKRLHGRPPRVLHIGNIANNGYRNSIALHQAGIQSHVLCYDYWHIMGCPEWEAAHFDSTDVDDFLPQWQDMDLGGYERPRWFAQGRLGTAMDYLISLCEGDVHTDELWERMSVDRATGGKQPATAIYHELTSDEEQAEIAERLSLEFALTFPRRKDQLSAGEIIKWASYALSDMARVRRLLSHYDFIVGYSTDGMIPLLADRRDYVCYEHGTIRLIPFDRTFQGRMCALTYARAGDVLITNCDNIAAARKLNLADFRFTPHAMLEEWRDSPAHAALRRKLMAEHDADFIVFHPARQHWEQPRNLNFDKANDVLIEAFAKLVKEHRPKALLIMIAWGETLSQSRDLIDRLGIADRVVWIKPMPVRVMQEYVAAADLLADQFAIGAWGGIMPIGMMLSTPVVIYLNEELHRWAFSEMPPIFNTRTVQEVLDAMILLLDPEKAKAARLAVRAWHDRYHSLSVVAGRMMDSFLNVQDADSEFARHDFDDQMVGMGRHLSGHINRLTSSLVDLNRMAGRFEGAVVPKDARALSIFEAEDIYCSEFWSNAGASIEVLEEGVRVITPQMAWHYAAAAPLDLSEVDFDIEHAWVRVFLENVTENLRVALYEDGVDSVRDEIAVQPSTDVTVIDLKPVRASEHLIMFRTGEEDGSASAIYHGAHLLTAPAYLPRRRASRKDRGL